MTARRRRTGLDAIAYEAHELSKYAGDASALQSGGPLKLGKRVLRRNVTRRGLGPLLNRLFR